MPSSGGSSQPRDQTQVSALQADSLLTEPAGKPKNTGVGSLPLLQEVCLTQESKQGLLHCRQILYRLSQQESLKATETKATAAHTDFCARVSPVSSSTVKGAAQSVRGLSGLPLGSSGPLAQSKEA